MFYVYHFALTPLQRVDLSFGFKAVPMSKAFELMFRLSPHSLLLSRLFSIAGGPSHQTRAFARPRHLGEMLNLLFRR